MKRTLQLFNYSAPHRAAQTLKVLRRARPNVKFDVVVSPEPAYAFRYLIKATMPDHRTTYVRRCQLGALDTMTLGGGS